MHVQLILAKASDLFNFALLYARAVPEISEADVAAIKKFT